MALCRVGELLLILDVYIHLHIAAISNGSFVNILNELFFSKCIENNIIFSGTDMYGNTLLQKSPGGAEKVLALTRPMRSMSLRERHENDLM